MRRSRDGSGGQIAVRIGGLSASLIGVAAAVLGCSATTGGPSTQVSAGLRAEAGEAAANPARASEPAGPGSIAAPSSPRRFPGRPVTLIDDPAQLARLAHARDFGALVFGQPAASTRELYANPGYRELVAELDPNGIRHGAIELSRRWLHHDETSLALVAVVNRIDRRDFAVDGCGETRLIFRLGYHESSRESGGESGSFQRLPVAFNLIFAQGDDGRGCVEVARRWMVADGEDPIAALTGEGGPLAPDALARARLLGLETNVRVFEDPSAAGVNELRAFTWDPEHERLVATGLEFEPRYKALLVRKDVAAWLTPAGLADIERGAGLAPELPVRARVAEVPVPDDGWRAYASLWQRNEFDALVQPEASASANPGSIASPEALEHRLDGMSCSGCHLARSVAGFHLPGEGGSERLRGGASAHLLAELPWRARYVEALANGESPDPVRKLPDDGPAGFGRRCSVPGSPIADFACDPGFACVDRRDAAFGVCLPEGYAGPAPCERGGPECWAPSPWFPGGFSRRACEEGSACAPVPTRSDSTACRERDDRWACAHARATPVRVDACDDQSDCRDGHACVGADDPPAGVCLPVASLAEFRVIGHAARLR